MEVHVQKVVIAICGVAVVLLFAATMMLLVSQPTSAKPEFAASTGKPCGACHVNPAGGGKLTKAGERYKKTLK